MCGSCGCGWDDHHRQAARDHLRCYTTASSPSQTTRSWPYSDPRSSGVRCAVCVCRLGYSPYSLSRTTTRSTRPISNSVFRQIPMMPKVRPTGNGRSNFQADFTSAVEQLTGHIEQRPPAFSAVHIAGERAYTRAARRGCRDFGTSGPDRQDCS